MADSPISYAAVVSKALPEPSCLVPYRRRTSLRVRPRRNTRIAKTSDAIHSTLRTVYGLQYTDIQSVYAFNRAGVFEVEFVSEAALERFRGLYRTLNGQHTLDIREFDVGHREIVVTRVPKDYPDGNIRIVLEKLGQIKIGSEGKTNQKRNRNGGIYYDGTRKYRVSLEEFVRMRELPQILYLGESEQFLISYPGMPSRCHTCAATGHLARDCPKKNTGPAGPVQEHTGPTGPVGTHGSAEPEGETETGNQQNPQTSNPTNPTPPDTQPKPNQTAPTPPISNPLALSTENQTLPSTSYHNPVPATTTPNPTTNPPAHRANPANPVTPLTTPPSPAPHDNPPPDHDFTKAPFVPSAQEHEIMEAGRRKVIEEEIRRGREIAARKEEEADERRREERKRVKQRLSQFGTFPDQEERGADNEGEDRPNKRKRKKKKNKKGAVPTLPTATDPYTPLGALEDNRFFLPHTSSSTSSHTTDNTENSDIDTTQNVAKKSKTNPKTPTKANPPTTHDHHSSPNQPSNPKPQRQTYTTTFTPRNHKKGRNGNTPDTLDERAKTHTQGYEDTYDTVAAMKKIIQTVREKEKEKQQQQKQNKPDTQQAPSIIITPATDTEQPQTDTTDIDITNELKQATQTLPTTSLINTPPKRVQIQPENHSPTLPSTLAQTLSPIPPDPSTNPQLRQDTPDSHTPQQIPNEPTDDEVQKQNRHSTPTQVPPPRKTQSTPVHTKNSKNKSPKTPHKNTGNNKTNTQRPLTPRKPGHAHKYREIFHISTTRISKHNQKNRTQHTNNTIRPIRLQTGLIERAATLSGIHRPLNFTNDTNTDTHKPTKKHTQKRPRNRTNTKQISPPKKSLKVVKGPPPKGKGDKRLEESVEKARSEIGRIDKENGNAEDEGYPDLFSWTPSSITSFTLETPIPRKCKECHHPVLELPWRGTCKYKCISCNSEKFKCPHYPNCESWFPMEKLKDIAECRRCKFFTFTCHCGKLHHEPPKKSNFKCRDCDYTLDPPLNDSLDVSQNSNGNISIFAEKCLNTFKHNGSTNN